MAPGSLSKANNAINIRENVLEDRRGYKVDSTLANNIKTLIPYSNKILAHHGTTISYGLSGSYADYAGTYSEPTSNTIKAADAAGNLYFTTSLGVKVFENATGTLARSAGAPRSLDISYVLNAASAGFLANNFQCAYRATIRRTDTNANVFEGYPSQRMWAVNASGSAKNLDLTLYIPSECAVGDVIRFYRTVQVSGTATDTSGDEMGLIYQYTLVAADITAGFISFTDSITDALRGETIYTAPSEQGIIQANDRPPLCKDIALFRSSFMFYANTQTAQRLFLSLVGSASLGSTGTGDTTNTSTTVANVSNATSIAIGWKVFGAGISAGTTVSNIVGSTVTLSSVATATNVGVALTFVTNQTIILSGVTYNFGNTEISSGAGSPQAKVSLTGVAAFDIDVTARSLIRVINRYATNTTVSAFYLSGSEELPGQMLIQEKGVGAAAFTVLASASAISSMFFPPPPVSPSTNSQSTSSNSVQKNALYYSKFQEFEHVPTLNYVLVGPANKEILRIAPLRESLIIIKEDGVYRLTGEATQNFSVTPLDLTVICKAPESVKVVSNQVMMFSNQGVFAISETGVQVVSREIENLLAPLIAKSTIASFTSAVSYESDRHYLLSTITDQSDSAANQTLVYNIFTRTWVRWTYAIKSGVVDPLTDKMYFSKDSSLKLFVERKTFTTDDYADPESDITIDAINLTTNTIDFTLSSATPDVGWVVLQGSSYIGVLSFSVLSASSYWAVLDGDIPASWTTGASTIYPSVGFDVAWNAWTANQPGTLKQVRAFKVLSDNSANANSVSKLYSTFRSNFDEEQVNVLISQDSGSWGSGGWGAIGWGGGTDPYGYPTWVPRNKQYCTRLFVGVMHKRAFEKVSIIGCSFDFEAISDRIGR
ncbi:MAG: hypothetical protein H0X02_01615 [Nitrosomonas sp.]|nr:hypothetical protein [Nitrosomonas sp.]